MNRVVLPLLLVLAACGTPQEQCIGRATRDLRTVERLLAETTANLDRGFAYEEVIVYRPVRVICDYVEYPPPADGSPTPPPRPRYCWDEREEIERRPRAIDPADERAKLAGLTAKRTQLTRSAAGPIAACSDGQSMRQCRALPRALD